MKRIQIVINITIIFFCVFIFDFLLTKIPTSLDELFPGEYYND